MIPTSNFITVSETAAWLNISRRSVFRLLSKGMPSTMKPGIGRRVLKMQAENWLILNMKGKRK